MNFLRTRSAVRTDLACKVPDPSAAQGNAQASKVAGRPKLVSSVNATAFVIRRVELRYAVKPAPVDEQRVPHTGLLIGVHASSAPAVDSDGGSGA